MKPQDVLSPAQVAKLLGRRKETVYRLLERGQIRGTMIGRRWYILRKDLEALLAGDDDLDPEIQAAVRSWDDEPPPPALTEKQRDVIAAAFGGGGAGAGGD